MLLVIGGLASLGKGFYNLVRYGKLKRRAAELAEGEGEDEEVERRPRRRRDRDEDD